MLDCYITWLHGSFFLPETSSLKTFCWITRVTSSWQTLALPPKWTLRNRYFVTLMKVMEMLQDTRQLLSSIVEIRSSTKYYKTWYKTFHQCDMFSLIQITIHSHKQLLPIHSQTFLHFTPASSSPYPHLYPLHVFVCLLVDCVSEWLLEWLTVGIV